MKVEFVQQVSLSTRVSFTKFTRRRHCQALRKSVLGFLSLGGGTDRRGAGADYALGFVMHLIKLQDCIRPQ